jgi:uncharacterized phage-associated protein
MEANRDKIKSAVAYIAGKVQPGKVKLFKLLYLADFAAHARFGESITGDMYENFEMGPVPRTLWKNFTRIASECVQITQVDTGVIPEQQMSPKSGFNPSLTENEKLVIDAVLAKWGHASGNELRDYAHTTIPYRATGRGDAIPYGLSAYIDYEKIDFEEAKAVCERPDVARSLAKFADPTLT